MGKWMAWCKKTNGLHTVFKESHEFYFLVLLFYLEQEKEE